MCFFFPPQERRLSSFNIEFCHIFHTPKCTFVPSTLGWEEIQFKRCSSWVYFFFLFQQTSDAKTLRDISRKPMFNPTLLKSIFEQRRSLLFFACVSATHVTLKSIFVFEHCGTLIPYPPQRQIVVSRESEGGNKIWLLPFHRLLCCHQHTLENKWEVDK